MVSYWSSIKSYWMWLKLRYLLACDHQWTTIGGHGCSRCGVWKVYGGGFKHDDA